MRQLPRISTWLLENFRYGPHSDALVGDLIEQFQHGRSRYWYYRQVAVALATGMIKGGRENRLRTLAGLLAGCSVFYVYGLIWGPLSQFIVEFNPNLPLGRYVFTGVFPRTWLLHYTWIFLMFSELVAGLLVCFTGALSGWVVSRIGREVRGPAVLLFAALASTYSIGWFVYVISRFGAELAFGTSVIHPFRNFFSFITIQTFTAIAILGILVGGGLSRPRRKEDRL